MNPAGTSVAGTEVLDGAPGIRTPEQIVAAALHRLEAGRMSATPRLVNHMATTAVRIAPRSLVVRASGR